MGLFNRKKRTPSNGKEPANEHAGETRAQRFLRRPGNTAFKQQRLKAWQPILTPKTVLPTLFVLGIIFGPIGGALIWGSDQVSQFTIDYTSCETLATSTFTEIPAGRTVYSFHRGNGDFQQPQWQYQANPTAANILQRSQCNILFNVPKTISHPVFMYYKLNHYYQNHRRYVKSLDSDQLKGDNPDYGTVQGGQCKPLDVIGDRIVYPCGLIANSVFNDSYTQPVYLNSSGVNTTYNFVDRGIAWPGESNQFQPTSYTADQIVPPPYWALRYPNGYQNGSIFNPHYDEHFQVWMRTAALPTFRKLYFRNDNDDMAAGTYLITAYLNYPVTPWGGKSLVFTNVAWIGGKNPFLGWAFVATSILCVAVGLLLTLRHLIKPRRLGDLSYLSWNQPSSSAQATR